MYVYIIYICLCVVDICYIHVFIYTRSTSTSGQVGLPQVRTKCPKVEPAISHGSKYYFPLKTFYKTNIAMFRVKLLPSGKHLHKYGKSPCY